MQRGLVRTLTRARFDTLATGVDATLRVQGGGGVWNFAVGRLAARFPGVGLAVTKADGRARLAGDRLALDHLRVRTDAGWVEFAGGGRLHGAGGFDGDLKAGEWTWHALSKLLRQPELDVSGGFAGRAQAHLDDAGLRITAGSADVLWRDEPAQVAFAGTWRDGRLALERTDVRWRSARWTGGFNLVPASGAWRLDGQVTDLDLHDLPRVWPMPALDSLRVSADVNLGGDKRGLDGRVARGRAVWRGQALDSLTGTWGDVAGRQTIAASARAAGGRVSAAGTLSPHALDARIVATGVDAKGIAPRLWRALGLAPTPAPAGRMETLEAHLAGEPSAPAIEGRARVTAVARHPLAVAHASVQFHGALGKDWHVDTNVLAGDSRVGPAHADTAMAQVVLSATRIEVPAFRAERAESVLVLHGFAARANDAWQVEVDSLDWKAGDRIALSGDGPIKFRIEPDGGLTVDRARIRSTAGSLAARGRWGGAHGASDFTLDLTALDLEELLGTVAADDRIGGRLTGSAHYAGAAGHGAWDLDLDGTDLHYRAQRVRALTVHGRIEDTTWRLAGVDLDTGQGRIHAAGRIDWSAPPPWTGGSDDWNHALTQSPHWEGTIATDSLALAQLSEFWPRAGGWRGDLTVTANLSGRPSAPAFSATGKLGAPGWGQASLDDFALALDYHDDILTVDRFAMQGPDSVGPAITGKLPLRLGWGVAAADRLPELPMELNVFAHRLDLGLAPLLLPQIAGATGRADLTMRVTGTPKHPYASGSLVVSDGVVRPANREEVLTSVTGRVALAGDELRVESFEARQGKRGRIVVKPGGIAHLKDLRIADYAFSLTAANVTAFSSGEYVLEMNGDFDVKNGADLGGPLPIPHITGTATVLEGAFLTNFADPDVQAAVGPAELPPWTYDVRVEARNNLWWRPPDANIEGKLTDFEVVQSLDRFLLLGQVDAVRGRYFFLGNQFDVKSGTLFFDAAYPLNPTVDATLTTQKGVTPVGGQAGQTQESITLAVSGRALTPTITMSSSPSNLSPTEIASLLTYGQFQNASRGAAIGQAGQAAGSYLLQQLLRDPDLAPILGGFEWGTATDLSLVDPSQSDLVVPGTGTTTARSFTKLGMSRYVTRDLLVRYSQVVGDVTGAYQVDYQDLGAEYRLSRLLFLQGGVTRRRGSLVPSNDETLYNLDVRARYEY